MSNSPLEYPFPEPPAPGTVLQVAAGVYWLRMPLPFSLDHINLWLLEDGAGWTIVDTGIGTEVTRQLWEQIFAAYLQGRPVKRVIVTHLHPDHMGLAAWMAERFRVEVWMTQAEFMTAHMFWSVREAMHEQQNTFFRKHGLDETKLAELARRTTNYRSGVPALPASLHRILGGDAIEINGRSWRVLIGYGHSPEHASLHCEELGVMIAGDMVLPRISTNVAVTMLEPEGNPLGLFLESLRRFCVLPADTLVLPSHGLVFRGLHARLEQLQQHHAERFDVLVKECAQPRAAADLLGVLFKREIDSHQLWFAMGETIAHLNYLMYAQRLQRIEGDVHRFVTA